MSTSLKLRPTPPAVCVWVSSGPPSGLLARGHSSRYRHGTEWVGSPANTPLLSLLSSLHAHRASPANAPAERFLHRRKEGPGRAHLSAVSSSILYVSPSKSTSLPAELRVTPRFSPRSAESNRRS
jgi:hypothetical protein